MKKFSMMNGAATSTSVALPGQAAVARPRGPNVQKRNGLMSKIPTKGDASYTAPVAQKTVRVLNLIVATSQNLGISEIASRLSLAKSTTHGILAALEEAGWVVRDPVSRKYTCGYVFKDLVASAQVRIPMVAEARPLLEKLALELDEDVFLGTCARYSILVLDQVESSQKLKLFARPGTRLPMYAGASGKIFLAYHEPEMVRQILDAWPLPQYTPRSITDRAAYLEELEKVRRQGFALDVEEYIPDVRAVSVPIFHGKNNRRRMVAGLWIVRLGSGMTEEKMKEAVKLGTQTGEAISAAITVMKP